MLLFLPPVQEWTRNPAPGVEYRMIVQDEPKLVAVALRFASDAPYRFVATQARDEVYDLTPTNGRATLGEIVSRTGALGGINGDFFQWGKDPGGDPMNLMVRHGELLSAPGTGGDRSLAWGWGGGRFAFGTSTWTADSSLGPVEALNAYTPAKGLGLSTASAGYAISKAPATFVVLDVGPKLLTPKCDLDGTVTQIVEDVEKLRVNPGTMVLSTQDRRDALRVPLGTKVRINVGVRGFDWKKVDQVVGGGPELLRGGRNVAPTAGEFNAARHPRTVVGRDAKGGIWLLAIDGRMNQSLGASLPEAATLAARLGMTDAMNLDGGGSTTLNLFGGTINRPSGGVQRSVGNAVLFFGPRPTNVTTLNVVLGEGNRLGLVDTRRLPADPEKIVWSAQGKAWIDGDGVLHPLETGETVVRAVYEGRVYETKVTLAGAGKATTDPD